MQKVVFHFKNWENYEIIVNFLVKAHVISFPPHAPPLMSLLSTWMEDHLHNPPKTWSRLDAQGIFREKTYWQLYNFLAWDVAG